MLASRRNASAVTSEERVVVFVRKISDLASRTNTSTHDQYSLSLLGYTSLDSFGVI
jgi:hypothetical protein